MVVKCEIKFDSNNYGIYFAGQTMTGRVELQLDKPKKVRGINLKINGFATCEWRESRGNRKRNKGHGSQTYRFYGREDYMSTTTYFAGSQENNALSLNVNGFACATWSDEESIAVNGKMKKEILHFNGFEEYIARYTYLSGQTDGNPIEIAAGQHVYNFSCTLPPLLPTSFEGRYGHIRYTICVTLERPWKFDQTYRVGFTVLKAIDLNYDTPALRMPCQMDMMKNFCCGPCRSGPFSMSASIPLSGYVPGQLIVVVANISNGTNIRVEEVKFSLKKIIAYISQTPIAKYKFEEINISEVRNPGLGRKENGRFEKNLPIPAVPPTNTLLCKVIQITYEVHVEAKVAGAHQNPLIKIPLTIGTIPLINTGTIAMPISTYNAGPKPLDLRPDVLTIQPGYEFNSQIPTAPGTTPPALTSAPVASQQVAPEPAPVPTPLVARPVAQAPPMQPIQIPIFSTEANESDTRRLSDIPPPSYEQCVFGTTQIEDENDRHPIGSVPFAPMYPVYHFDNTNQTMLGQQTQTQTMSGIITA